MTIEIECQCGSRFAAQERLAGKRVKCPACGAPLAVPAARPAQREVEQVRCQFCHEYIPRSEYDRHAQQHLKLQDDGEQTDYATLPVEEREGSSEFEQAPRWYRHQKCGGVTGMPEEIIQTYLTNPWFYLSDKTFCTECEKHVRQRECVWEETGENLQTYSDRLRAAKPELRPGAFARFFAWMGDFFN